MREKRWPSTLNRRDFLRGAAGMALAGAAVDPGCSEETRHPAGTSRVVLVRDADVLSATGEPQGARLEQMLDEALMTLVGTAEPLAAWKSLIRPGDTVGVKSNVWQFLPTPRALEDVIRRRLLDVGVGAERISFDDRGVLRNPVFHQATALINVRPLRTHHWSGVGSLIKNYIMFSDDPPSWHGDSCANLAGLWDLPQVRGKTRFNILVMLTPQFHSKGPHAFNKRYTWPYRGLLVGTDPVALDATGLRILEAQRLAFFGVEEPFTVSPKHIRVAAEKYGLGIADPARIELVRLGWKDGVLI